MMNREEKELLAMCIAFLRQHISSPSHDLKHSLDVLKYSLFLGRKHKANRKVLIVASILHDFSRHYGARGELQGEESVRLLEEFLNRLPLLEEEKKSVEIAITSHSLRKKDDSLPIEAKIISDADKLAGLGVIGLLRISMYAGEIGKGFSYVKRKLFEDMKHRKRLLYLDESKKLAEQLDREIMGIRELLRKKI
ncbi:HD domain-containing protein [Candidatus Woesearchaeota archaeon]|nr:HD domain-containing protein [Candidatus Woesearchaeota archaeon]